MTIVPRLQNSSNGHQPRKEHKNVNKKNVQRDTKCLNSDNIESFYCCTNFDKSTLSNDIS